MKKIIFHRRFFGGMLLASVLLLGSFFLFSQNVRSQNTDIVINEIGSYEPSQHEWLEITNKGDDAIDLENWKFWEGETNHTLNLAQGDDYIIEPGEYAIIAQNDINFINDYPNVTTTIFDSSWGTLNEGGEEIGIKDNDGEFVEKFTYVQASNFSLERKDANEQDYSETNWAEHPDSNTVGEKNYQSSQDADPTEDEGEEETEEDEQATTSTPKIVINEFVSDPETGQNEWIELYNTSSSSVNLNGWTLHDGVGQIYAPTTTIAANSFALITLSSSKLNNSGDIIILKNSEEQIIDQISYGSWDDGNTSDNAPAVGDPNSVARIANGQDTGNDQNDFSETTTPTPGVANNITLPATEAPSVPEGSSGPVGPSAPTYYSSDIVINELVSDPIDDAEEFVELFNNKNVSIDLANWWIEDGSETKTNLNGTISGNSFFVIQKPNGNLNNSGDIVILFDPTGKEIDKITYGSWDDGNVADNAPSAEDPFSLIRKVDGQDGNNDYYDFVLTNTITKGAPNVLSGVIIDGETIDQAIGTTDIIINELLPNPIGTDSLDEWIELKNTGSVTIDLTGWKLGDASTKRYEIKQGSIAPLGFIVFKRSMTGIALNNTGGDEVSLYGPNNTLLDKIKYTGSASESESYARRDDNSWAWSTKPTPGSTNVVKGKSSAPIINIEVDAEVAVGEPVNFDASDTTDPEGDEIIFSWNFDDGKTDEGDVVEHRFLKEGVYTVKLIVTDTNGNESIKTIIITVKSESDFSGGYLSTDAVEKLKISEFIPNPKGSDTTEFIELYNPTDNEIDLSGLKLDDEEGGSRAYTIPDKTIILAGEYKVFGRQDTKLALNNTNDSVRILYPDGTILSEVQFDDVIEGASYIQDENENWIWTSSVTPGEVNIISVLKTQTTARAVSKSKSKSKRIKPIIQTTLEKIRDEDIGDMVKITGIVAVEPGVLGTQYFYIVGSPGVQIYSFKKTFPKLAVGDRIEVTGEISESTGNTRIKISEASNIKIIDHPGETKPNLADIADIGEPLEGQLIQVNGEITEIKSSYMYVDDGTEEVRVYFKRGAGINSKLLSLGDIANVVGIIQQTKDGYQLLPRSQDDIIKTGVSENVVIVFEQTEEESQKEVAEKYLTATAGGLTSILIGLFAKGRGALARKILKSIGGVAIAVVKRKK